MSAQRPITLLIAGSIKPGQIVTYTLPDPAGTGVLELERRGACDHEVDGPDKNKGKGNC